jgi:hypothetical protein
MGRCELEGVSKGPWSAGAMELMYGDCRHVRVAEPTRHVGYPHEQVSAEPNWGKRS